MLQYRKTCLLLLFFFISGIIPVRSEIVLLRPDVEKRVLVPDENIGSQWRRELEYDDSAWLTSRGAPGGIGYERGTGYETLISLDVGNQMYQSNTSCYIRMKFQVTEAQLNEIASLQINVQYDDGFILYLNGNQLLNVGGPWKPQWNSDTSLNHEAETMENARLYGAHQYLQAGENLLAVQGLNHGLESSDFLFLCELSGNETPFDENTVSNLPLVFLNTGGESIPDESRIQAHLSVIDHGTGQAHRLIDSVNGYNGSVSIEVRGSSSSTWPKLQYGFETQDEAGENNNVELLGLPRENDWILNNPYIDKSLMRNVLTYHLAREMGRYAPRTRYCELFLNQGYHGLYVLTEKIKRDNDRVDIARLDADDVAGDSLTGGYILKIDKAGNDGFVSDYPSVTGNRPITIQFHYPKDDEIQPQQAAYIETFIRDFENAMAGPQFTDPASGYAKYIDTDSFIDFMLLSELGKNVDSYRISTFFYKDRDDNDGGRLNAGPVWDFNLAYGLANYYDGEDTDDWNVNTLTTGEEIQRDSHRPPFWFSQLLQDAVYKDKMRLRWESLRETIFSKDYINGFLDATADTLREAQARNFAIWSPPGQYGGGFWPAPDIYYSFSTHEDEVNYLKSWISDRIDWMDANMGFISGVNGEKTGLPERFLLGASYPNPFNAQTTIPLMLNDAAEIDAAIFDLKGRLVCRLAHGQYAAGSHEWTWAGVNDAGDSVASGVYMCRVQVNGKAGKSNQERKLILIK